jgi:hypothetical protein
VLIIYLEGPSLDLLIDLIRTSFSRAVMLQIDLSLLRLLLLFIVLTRGRGKV